jgi:hypothetical protein
MIREAQVNGEAKREYNGLETLGNVGDGAEEAVMAELPYVVEAQITGTAPLLFCRWDVEAVEGKAKGRKGSKVKKTDNVDTYVYRNKAGQICVPGEYFRMSAVNAARYHQDPRSSRKSAMDIFKAGIIPMSILCSLGMTDWDYLDRRRVSIQRGSSITRTRPAFREGWQATVELQCLLPEYISPSWLHEVLTLAGRCVGVGDFRPTFGRFRIDGWKVLVP